MHRLSHSVATDEARGCAQQRARHWAHRDEQNKDPYGHGALVQVMDKYHTGTPVSACP